MTFIETNAKWQAHAFVLLYHPGEANHCPFCAGTHWYVGRISSECARCGMALPLATNHVPLCREYEGRTHA